MPFEYPCPDCGTTVNVHDRQCKYSHQNYDHPDDEHLPIRKIRKAYTDILSTLLAQNAAFDAADAPPGISFERLVEKVNEQLTEQPEPEMWKDIHTECLHELKNRRRVAEEEQMGGLYVRTPEARADEIIPTFDPIKTIYECGPVDGAKDYAVYTMISWCELVGLDWEQTCNFMHEWLEETEAWDDLRWGESSIQELLDSKQHIHDKGLGWGDYADIAAREIDAVGREPRIDARAKVGNTTPDDYES